jgi:hypothetical protein
MQRVLTWSYTVSCHPSTQPGNILQLHHPSSSKFFKPIEQSKIGQEKLSKAFFFFFGLALVTHQSHLTEEAPTSEQPERPPSFPYSLSLEVSIIGFTTVRRHKTGNCRSDPITERDPKGGLHDRYLMSHRFRSRGVI